MSEQHSPMSPSDLDISFAEQIRDSMARWHIPGAAVGVLKDGVRQEQGFGVASLETGYPVRADSLFQIGSITKLFTATMVMMLVEEGKLALDRPVVDYLPEFHLADTSAQAHVTVRMLLTHTSGFFGDLFDDTGMGDDALTRFLGHLQTLEQQSAPGEVWAYNNAGFIVAGALIARLTGLPYEQTIRERIFKPLGMERSFYFAHEAMTYPVAVGHRQTTPGGDEHEVARLYHLPRAVHPAGGIISSVDDLLTFAQFQFDGGVTRDGQRLLSEATLREMWRTQTKAANFAESYGLGFELEHLDGVTLIGHGGSTNGFQAHLKIVPERKFAIATLTNSDRGSAMYHEAIASALAEQGLVAPKRQPTALPDDALARFVGRYKRPNARVTVTTTGAGLRREVVTFDELNLTEEHYPLDDLLPLSSTEFICVTPGQNYESQMDFLLDSDGNPRYLRMGGRLAARVNE